MFPIPVERSFQEAQLLNGRHDLFHFACSFFIKTSLGYSSGCFGVGMVMSRCPRCCYCCYWLLEKRQMHSSSTLLSFFYFYFFFFFLIAYLGSRAVYINQQNITKGKRATQGKMGEIAMNLHEN